MVYFLDLGSLQDGHSFKHSVSYFLSVICILSKLDKLTPYRIYAHRVRMLKTLNEVKYSHE